MKLVSEDLSNISTTVEEITAKCEEVLNASVILDKNVNKLKNTQNLTNHSN